MKNQNIFIAESPFQLINAIEAINYFSKHEDENLLVVRYTRNLRVKKQFQSVLNSYDIANVSTFYIGNYLPKLFVFSVLGLLIKTAFNNRNKTLFIGEYRSIWMRLYSFIVTGSKFYLLDDGNVSIAIHEAKYGFSKIDNPQVDSIKYYIIKYLKTPLMNSLFNGVAKITPFSMYDLKPYEGQKVIRNNYLFLSSMLSGMNENDQIVYFIGSNLVEQNIISKEDHLSALKVVIERYVADGKKVIYMMHRFEGIKNLSGLISEFPDEFEIIQPDIPIELYYLTVKQKPTHIASFASTALGTIAKIYKPLSAVSYRIPRDMFKSSIREMYDQYYDEYQKDDKIEVIKID